MDFCHKIRFIGFADVEYTFVCCALPAKLLVCAVAVVERPIAANATAEISRNLRQSRERQTTESALDNRLPPVAQGGPNLKELSDNAQITTDLIKAVDSLT